MKILFQGDSITDCLRSRDEDRYMGMGYPTLVSAELSLDNPGKYEFVNRGISGNRVVDLYAREKSDIINLAPDVMSIFIGVNDAWHEFDWANGVTPERFYDVYCMLIDDVRSVLPNIKMIILEPFVIDSTITQGRYEAFRGAVEERAAMAKKVAQKYGFPFIPLQSYFDELVKIAPATVWCTDGVHPTDAGHEFIKRKWIEAFKTL